MAFCINCGSQVPDGAKFCAACGTPVAVVPAPAPTPGPELVPEPVAIPAPEPVPEPVIAPAPEPIPEPVVEADPETVPEPVAAPIPEPEPEPVVAPAPAPVPAPAPMHFEQVQPADVDDDLNMEGPPIVGNYTIPGMENVTQQPYTAPVAQPQAIQPQVAQPHAAQAYTSQPQAAQTYAPQPQAAPKAPKPPKQPSEGGSKFGTVMMIIIGALIAITLLVAIVGFVLKALGIGDGSSKKAGGSGTALTELLDNTAATYYNGGGASSNSSDNGDWDDDEEDGDDSVSVEGVVGPGGDESRKIANQFVGSYERKEDDYMTIDVPDGWFGMDGGIEGKYSGFNQSAGNGPNGTVDAFVYYDQEYTDAIVEDQMNTTKQYRFESTVDIDDIEIDGITLKGFEGVEETLGKKVLTRLYMGIKDGKCLMIEFKTNELDGAVFSEPAPWNMIYSIKVK